MILLTEIDGRCVPCSGEECPRKKTTQLGVESLSIPFSHDSLSNTSKASEKFIDYAALGIPSNSCMPATAPFDTSMPASKLGDVEGDIKHRR